MSSLGEFLMKKCHCCHSVIRKTDTGLKEKEITRSIMACSEYTSLSPAGTLQRMVTKGCVCFAQHRVTQTNNAALLND